MRNYENKTSIKNSFKNWENTKISVQPIKLKWSTFKIKTISRNIKSFKTNFMGFPSISFGQGRVKLYDSNMTNRNTRFIRTRIVQAIKTIKKLFMLASVFYFNVLNRSNLFEQVLWSSQRIFQHPKKVAFMPPFKIQYLYACKCPNSQNLGQKYNIFMASFENLDIYQYSLNWFDAMQ